MDFARESGEYRFLADIYDYVVPYRNRPDVAFFVEAAKESGGPVLEVGCGTGRILIPTARAGIKIVGLDLSSHMLNVCRGRLMKESREVQSKIQLVEADMRHFSLEQFFMLITMPFRPFQHLTTVDDQLSCLQCIHRHLAKRGRLILDIFNPSLESLTRENVGQEWGDEPEFMTPDGRRVVRRHKIASRDRFNQIEYVEMVYYVTHPSGRQEKFVHSFPMRYLFRFEAEHLLTRCGFEIEQVYADFDKDSYGSKYPGELIFVARKRDVW